MGLFSITQNNLKFKFDKTKGGYSVISCNKLVTKVVVPEVVKGHPVVCIEKEVFGECTMLTELTLPVSVTKIEGANFYNCKNLSKVIYQGSLKYWSEIEFDCASSCPLIFGAKLYVNNDEEIEDLVIPNDTTHINKFAFCGGNFNTVTISNGVKWIGEGAFSGSNIKSIDIANDVEIIYEDAFCGCSNLTSVKVGNSVTTIKERAFESCNNLQVIYLPKSLEKICEDAFYECENLKEVYYDGEVLNWCNILFENDYGNKDSSCCPLCYGASLFIGGQKIIDLVIPNGVSEIKEFSFNIKDLQSVTIPSSVTKIGYKAFYECENIKNVYYDGDIVSWLSIVVNNKGNDDNLSSPLYNGANLVIDGEVVTEIILPSSVTSLPDYAFSCFKWLNKVVIEHEFNLGEYAFNDVQINELHILSSMVTTDVFKGCKGVNKMHYSGFYDEWKANPAKSLYCFTNTEIVTCAQANKTANR